MNAQAILSFITTKALPILESVWEDRDLAMQAVNSIKSIAANPSPTKADLDAEEATLDGLLAEFNAPLPPE